MLDFERNITEFNKQNIQVIAASVDGLEQAHETVARYKLSFKVGYGVDSKEISSKTGAFYQKEKGYIHGTGFVVNSEGIIVNGLYSTSAIGRLIPADCLGLIGYYMKKQSEVTNVK
ncbi:MAG: redoxin domain-containing protein [Nitrospirae bacterium]|nr:redoxin domain-containing protein [Nitrospirota bacterium]